MDAPETPVSRCFGSREGLFATREFKCKTWIYNVLRIKNWLGG
jgi:hypothetical protein